MTSLPRVGVLPKFRACLKGGKRYLMVNTLGLVMMIVVTSAQISNPQGAQLIFAKLLGCPDRIRRLVRIWVDGIYDGVDFIKGVMDTYQWLLETDYPLLLECR